MCQSCRRGAVGKRKSQSKNDDNEKGEELKELDFNSVEVENDIENDGSKVPLKSDT